MKKPFVIPALIFVMIFSAASAYAQTTVKENRDVKNFSVVNFGGSGDLYISFGQDYSLTIEGDKADIDNTTTEVDGKKLNIKRKNRNLMPDGKIIVHITMPAIEGLGISGSGNAEISDAVKGENLALFVSGNGKILLAGVEVANLDCSISGSGIISLNGNGKATNSKVAVSGSGSFNGEGIMTDSFEASISGSGNCYCYVNNSLEANISGSGKVIFSGSPKIDARVSGSGRVRSK